MARKLSVRELVNTRLANNYGGWIYCEGCNQTIGYLCYVTYDRFDLHYHCNCGNHGVARLAFDDEQPASSTEQRMVVIKNRFCCPADNSPLVTVLAKNLLSYQCEIVCKACSTTYREEQTR